ncbi:hypothetical protein CERSUDRAFT_151158 [Gelatoporia subvermispora B]|uniref:Protein-S-isoprenylcysteine O-methyltransferase n=1 Tax=Ceriporiopsis subvermispora (strain B) TaxID=914234 RepID=M2QSZ9_CERS8|nr:hypothetical protein CERSUDRAFT_151158 [Gelatoporia subvermispora B]
MSSSLLAVKVPLLFTAAVANHVTFTSPNPPPDPKEKERFGETGKVLSTIRPPWIRRMHRDLTWGIILCEMLVVLATIYPSIVSKQILVFLSPGRSATGVQVRITPTFLIGWILLVAGGYIRYSCYRTLGRHFTFELALRDSHRLITYGPYSVVRHPSYTASMMAGVGLLLCVTGRGSWLAESGLMNSLAGRLCVLTWAAEKIFVPIVMLLRVEKEDGALRKEFGDQWEEWAKKTPYKLIPAVF